MELLTDTEINTEITAIRARSDYLDRRDLVDRVNNLEAVLQRRHPPGG